MTETFFAELQREARKLKVEYSEAPWSYRWAVKKELPEVYGSTYLYHYTSQVGAHGVLNSQSIWATDAFFLNDPQEIGWGRKALKNAYGRLEASAQEKLSRMYIRLIEVNAEEGHQFDGLLRNRAYTVSFSTNGDALRQWRAYGGSRGVALGFNLKLLANTRPDALLAPVLYKNQGMLAEHFYNDLCAVLDSNEAQQLTDFELCNHLIERYATFLPLAKNPDYKDEAEWRLMIPGFRVAENDPSWRSGRDYAAPYLTIGLWNGGESSKLNVHHQSETSQERPVNQLEAYLGCRAVMGPEAHPLARQFFDKTLKGCVEPSKIKFRSS